MSERAIKHWRAREKAAFALHPILEREDLDTVSAGELADAAIEAFEMAMSEPLPDGWRKFIIGGSVADELQRLRALFNELDSSESGRVALREAVSEIEARAALAASLKERAP